MQKIPNMQKLIGELSKTASQALNKSIAKQAQSYESIGYDNHEMIISIGVSSLLVGVVVCVATGEVTILYIVASVALNTIIDVGVSLIYTAIMRAIQTKLKAKEAQNGQTVNIRTIPAELYA